MRNPRYIHLIGASVLAIALVSASACDEGEATTPLTANDGLSLQQRLWPGDANDTPMDPVVHPATCIPGESHCVNSEQSWQCTKDGLGYEVVQCVTGTACDPEAGRCRVQICDGGTATCTGIDSYHICQDSGTAFSDEVYLCDDSRVCVEGSCKLCWPGKNFCVTDDATATCDDSGESYGQAQMCPDGYRCHELNGACQPPICEPGALRCTNAFNYETCLPSGTGYAPTDHQCPPNHLCIDGECTWEPCVPNVMLLVDASASMENKWENVQTSVHQMVAAHQSTLFGLTFFPTNAGCGTTSKPQVPVGLYDADDMSAWFDSHMALGGTPLIDAMVSMVEGADSNFGNYGGALIVLSDGEDICGTTAGNNEAFVLETAARELWEDHHVRTYVIGYDYTGNDDALDILASNGGTGLTSHIQANDIDGLASAFQLVLSDVEACAAERPTGK